METKPPRQENALHRMLRSSGFPQGPDHTYQEYPVWVSLHYFGISSQGTQVDVPIRVWGMCVSTAAGLCGRDQGSLDTRHPASAP